MNMNYEEAVAFLNNVLTDDAPWCDAPIVNPEFDKNDIRSRVKIGWYVFAGGYVSSDKDAYPNCQGVVGIINNDPNAEKGNRVKVVLRHQEELEWCEKEIYTKVTNAHDGQANTQNLLEFGKTHGIKFPAMEFAQNYAFDGVNAGEAYVPTTNELDYLHQNHQVIDTALRQIGSCLSYFYWSSFESNDADAWRVGMYSGTIHDASKIDSEVVVCFLKY